MATNNGVVAEALRAYGSAMRGDWGSIDGRTVRDDLNQLADLLRPDAPPARLDSLLASLDVCPEQWDWSEHCGDEGERCPHLAEIRERLASD